MRRLLRIGLGCGGVAVLVLLVRQVGTATIVGLFGRLGSRLAIVGALYLAHVVVRATALWRTVSSHGVSYRRVLQVRFSGEAIEMLTFTGPFLSEPAKGWLLMQRGLSGVEAFAGVAIEYLAYTMTSAWMAIFALSWLLADGALPERLRGAVVAILIGLFAATAGFAIAASTGVGLLVPAARAIGAGGIAARLDPVERALVSFMHDRPITLLQVLGIEAVGQALLACELLIVVRTLGYAFAVRDAAVAEGAVKFISIAFFFVPGQIGASESVYTLLFESLGLPGAVGLTMALVRRVRGLAVAALAFAATVAR